MVIFHPYQRKIDHEVILKKFDIDGNELIPLDQKTYIGTLIDSTLTWKRHISYTASKISKTTGVIARLRHLVPCRTLTNIWPYCLGPGTTDISESNPYPTKACLASYLSTAQN